MDRLTDVQGDSFIPLNNFVVEERAGVYKYRSLSPPFCLWLHYIKSLTHYPPLVVRQPATIKTKLKTHHCNHFFIVKVIITPPFPIL